MKYIYIGTAADESNYKNYYSASASVVVGVQQKWDYVFCTALNTCFNDELFVISYPPVKTLPFGKTVATKRRKITGLQGFYIGVLNLPVIKQFFSVFSVARELRRIQKHFPKEEIRIITHTVYLQSLIAANVVKKRNPDIKIISLVPDLADCDNDDSLSSNGFIKALMRLYIKLSVKYEKKVDAYVCFSKQQMEKLNHEKPFIVMEGFANLELTDSETPAELNDGKFVFLYAGNLKRDSGVDLLAEAFQSADLKGAELWILGDGELYQPLEQLSCPGIKLLGKKPRNEVIVLEKAVDCLVNPRPVDEEYARYSFPSKLLEYMATATPVLSTRIPSLPEEYVDYLLFFSDYNRDAFKEKLIDVYENKYKNIGISAAKFVIEKKNLHYQAQRVADFVKSL